MAKSQKAGVLTGDIAGSSDMTAEQRKTLQRLINTIITKTRSQWPDLQAQQYRGDSIQVVLTKNRKYILRLNLLIQSLLITNHFKIRIATGSGEISYTGTDIVTSDGSAFHASGPYLDELRKKTEWISIAGNEKDFTDEWQVHSASLNFIIQKWSAQQAEAIHLHLLEHTQETIAKKLKIAQSSVNQRLQLAGWQVIQRILTRYETTAGFQ